MSDHTMDRLAATVASRKGASADSSYTAKLYAKGTPHIARKLGEEAVETVIAAIDGTDEELVGESADLLYHLMVLLTSRDIDASAVWAALESRTGQSGLEEKASRPKQD